MSELGDALESFRLWFQPYGFVVGSVAVGILVVAEAVTAVHRRRADRQEPTS